MKKKFAIAVVAVFVASLVFYFLFAKGNKNEGSISTSGIVEGAEVNLAAKISGKILAVCCREGEPVEEGQVAVELESEDVKAAVDQALAGVERAQADIAVSESEIENAKAGILAADADIKSAEADMERARVRMDEAKLDRDRVSDLYKKDFVAKASLDEAAAQHDASIAEYRAAQARLNAVRAKKDAAVAQASASKNQWTAALARRNEAEAGLSFSRAKLNDTVITSPIRGTVIFKALEKGETVSPGTTIMTVVDTENLFIRVDLEETLIGFVTLGGEATITVGGMPGRTITGKVVEVGKYAEFATQRDVTRGRQDIKTFRVKIDVEDSVGLLKPGMTVFVEMPKRG